MATLPLFTAVNVANQALAALGEPPIQSLDESIPAARYAKAHISASISYILSLHPWDFAKKSVLLAELAETPPPPFLHIYQLPVNIQRIIKVVDEEGYCVAYRRYENKLASDYEDLWLEYISGDYTTFPAEVMRAIALHLAHTIGPLLFRGRDFAELFQLYIEALSSARHKHATEAQGDDAYDEDWLASRNTSPHA